MLKILNIVFWSYKINIIILTKNERTEGQGIQV